MSSRCCLMILNYNGQRHLKDCLPTALIAAGAASYECSVVVLDNRSTDADVQFIRDGFPGVEVMLSDRNEALFSFTGAAARRTEDVVIFLDNDMRIDPGLVDALMQHFEDPEVFAVSAKVYDWEGKEATTGKRRAWFRNFWFYKEWDFDVRQACLTLYGGGGSAAFHRARFLQLGGFDRLYRPGYCEDLDLSYRAWKRGWKVLFEPAAVLYHKVGGTFGAQLQNEGRTRIIRRNEALFTVRNCGDTRFLAGYLALYPVRIMRSWIDGNRTQALGMMEALQRMPVAIWKRLTDPPTIVPDAVFLRQIAENAYRDG